MATSNKWRLLITANAGYSGMVGLGEWELRTSLGVARPFVRQSIDADVTAAGAASLGGVASLTQYWDSFAYYEMIALTLPFNINVGGLVTNQVVVNSYGMVSFGHDGSTYGWESWLDSGNAIPYPTIVHGSPQGNGASQFQRIYAGAENSGTTYRIRLEMFAGWDDPLDGSANTIWELTFYSAQPERIRIDFGTSGYAAVDGGGGVKAGMGDGVNQPHVATFASVVNQAYDIITAPIVAEGTVSASAAASSHQPSRSIDTLQTTAWIANVTPSVGTPVWLQYEFTSPQTIEQYMLKMSASSTALYQNAMPRDWTLQYWDGAAWQVNDTQAGQTAWAYDEQRTFDLVEPSVDGDITLPQLTMDALTAPPETYVGGLLTLPLATLSATWARGTDGQVTLGNDNNLGTVYNATPFALGAIGHRGYLHNGDIVLEEVELAGSLEGPLPLPLLTIDGVAHPGTIARGNAVLSAPTVLAATADPITFAELALAASGYAGTVARGEVRLPLAQADGALLAGTAASGAAALPKLLLTAGSGNDGNLVLPAATLAASGTAGTRALASLTLPKAQLEGAGMADQLPTDGALAWPALSVAATLATGTTASGAATLPHAQLSGAGIGDNLMDGALLLAAPTLAAQAVIGQIATGAARLSVWQLAAGGYGEAAGTEADGAVRLALPAAQGAMLAGRLGHGAVALAPVAVAGSAWGETLATASLPLRAPTVAATGSNNPAGTAPGQAAGALLLAQPAVAGQGLAGTLAAAALTLRPASVAASMVGEAFGHGAATLPQVAAAGLMAESGAPTSAAAVVALPALSLDATLGAGNMGGGALLLAPPAVTASAHASTEAAGALRFTLPGVAATGSVTAVINGNLVLEAPQLAATGAHGNIASAQLTVPLLHIDADGHLDTVGNAQVMLPVPAVDAHGTAGLAEPVFTGVVVNTRTNAASTYAGLAFNSLASFNGMVLAATPTGIVALTGDTDQGTPIAALLASGVTSMETDQFKRVLCGYAGYSATGTLELTLVTDTHHQYVYALVPEQVGQLHAARVKFGRGIDGRYWQWKLANKAGAHFALDALTLDATVLSRRT